MPRYTRACYNFMKLSHMTLIIRKFLNNLPNFPFPHIMLESGWSTPWPRNITLVTYVFSPGRPHAETKTNFFIMFSNFAIPLTVSQLILSASYFHTPRQWAQLLPILFSLWISSWTPCLALGYHSFLLCPKHCLLIHSAGPNRAN